MKKVQSSKFKVQNPKKKKILVALSGGVDSSIAAALLKKQRYNIIGIYLKFWMDPSSKLGFKNICCQA